MKNSSEDEFDEDEDQPATPSSRLPPAELELPTTELRVENGELRRMVGAEWTILRLPLDGIEQVAAGRKFNSYFLGAAGGGSACLAIGFLLVEDRWLVITLCLLGMLGWLQAFSRMWITILTVRFQAEDIVIHCEDAPDAVAGFAASLRFRISRRQ